MVSQCPLKALFLVRVQTPQQPSVERGRPEHTNARGNPSLKNPLWYLDTKRRGLGQKILRSMLDTFERYKNNLLEYKRNIEERDRLSAEKKSLKSGAFSFLAYAIVAIGVYFTLFRNDPSRWESVLASLLLAAWPGFLLWAFVAESEYFINLYNNGRLKNLKQQIEEQDRLIAVGKEKLKEDEKIIVINYKNYLGNFFQEKLFRKRSGSQEFESSLSEFQSIVEELTVLNQSLITTRVPLYEYKSYLEKRKKDHKIQALKQSPDVDTVRNFVRKVSEIKSQKQIILSPEKTYRTARKIENWDELTKKHRLTGAEGEGIVLALQKEYFESIDRKDLAEKVRHVSKEEGDGLGYDILSFFDDGKEKYIEVKSTKTSIENPYYLSRNEFAFLKENKDNAFIYRVFISSNDPQLKIESGTQVLENNEFIPIQYIVKAVKNLS